MTITLGKIGISIKPQNKISIGVQPPSKIVINEGEGNGGSVPDPFYLDDGYF